MPFPRATAKCAPHLPGASVSPPQATPRSTASRRSPRAIAPPWAFAPCSDSPGLDLAGESEQSDERRLKTNAPFLDSAVAALAGQSEQSDERRLKTNAPFLDSTVVTTGELPTTNAGLGSPLPSLRMVEHFWWSRPPHSESFLVSPPHPLRSSGLSQSRRRCEPSPGADSTHRYRRRRHSRANVRDLPSPPPSLYAIPRLREESRTGPLTHLRPFDPLPQGSLSARGGSFPTHIGL